jgi:hypothetical protein
VLDDDAEVEEEWGSVLVQLVDDEARLAAEEAYPGA